MKNKIKIIILCSLLFLLTGCGWKDVQEEYGDLLKKGITCTYYTDKKDSKNDFYGIEKLELSADYSGFYVNVGEEKKTIIDEKEKYNFIDIKGYQFNFNNDFIKDYLSQYQEKNNCAERLYVVRDNSREVRLENCEGLYYCDSYGLRTEAITTPDGEEKNVIIA